MPNTKLRTPYMIAQEKAKAKEVAATKNYLKNIWGDDIKLKKMSYQEIRKLGEELGMNVYNTKGFNDSYTKSQKRFKNYTRICKYCNEYYDIEIKRKSRPKGAGVCPTCKENNINKRNEDRKIKNKIKWERLVLDVLKKGERMSIKEITEELECSDTPIRKIFKILAKEGKIKILKAVTARIN